PELGRGIVVIDYLGASAYQRVHWWGGVYPVEHWTAYLYNKTVAGSGWEKLYPLETTNGAKTENELAAAGELLSSMLASNDPTLDYESKHAELVSEMTTAIGDTAVGDKAAIALVYDHGTTAFRDWIWPELKKRGLPATLALSPEVHLDGNGDSRHQATNEEIAAWVTEGLDIASHSGDHEGAVGAAAIWRQIVSSKSALESKLGTKVWSWVQPGYSLSDGGYDGFGTGQTAEAYTDTFAGRLLQKTYPVITGYVGDDYVYPMEPLPVGVQRSQIEEAGTVDTVKAYIEKTIATKGKHVTFVHPYALGNSGMVTKDEYLAFLDWLVGKRDAGELEVLTLPKLAIAHA
ncbi:polysaccharide deacetylase family protein, partial [Corynebacterium sp. HMSC076D02]|uniref:polysaccharide deacetylase family protein n=1 Tax=Corynebacterium sp. HMSC076D02 TaxID=1739439 RepID=UPI000B094927